MPPAAMRAQRTDDHPAIRTIADQLRAAHDARRATRLVGAGLWLDAGRPVTGDPQRLELGDLRGVTEYVPGDLTLTALAGTSLAEIQAATRANGQRLALDPFGTDMGTIGATVATASAGPLAAAYGAPRDNTLGLTFVTGTGEIVRAGGRVVKNVAGFDLVRLVTGAWGTLGAIVEVTVRLRALPAVDETFTVALEGGEDSVTRRIALLRALPFTYDALERLDPETARRLGVDAGPEGALLARASGTTATVHAMRAELAIAGTVRGADPMLWNTLRILESAGAATLRLSHRPTHAAAVWRAAREFAATNGGWAHLAVGRTVARVTLPMRQSESHEAFATRIRRALEQLVSTFDGACIAERLPDAAWAAMPTIGHSAARARLSRGVRAAFDPARLLNPGILGAEGGEA